MPGFAVGSPGRVPWALIRARRIRLAGFTVFVPETQAGTPENFKQFVVGGARGGDGAKATGSYSATGHCP